MDDDEPVLLLGSRGSDYVLVRPLGCPNREGWTLADIELRAGAFRGEMTREIDASGLAHFYDQLEPLYASLRGTARYSTLEPGLELDLTGDGLGHMIAECHAWDAGDGNHLALRLELDQTHLPAILRRLRRALEVFGIRPRRDGG